MISITRAGTFAALVSSALMVGMPAFSATLYASAGYTGQETGDYLIGSDGFGGYDYVAASFSLTQASAVTGVGGVFTAYGDGNSIFAAIIAAPTSQTDVNAASLPGLALAYTTFTPPQDDSDAVAPLSALLGPGNYEVVFGSGVFGTSGQSGLATGQLGAATLYQSLDAGADWGTLTDSVRVTVEGSPVPLPAALPLLLSGLGGIGALLRRRSTLRKE